MDWFHIRMFQQVFFFSYFLALAAVLLIKGQPVLPVAYPLS